MPGNSGSFEGDNTYNRRLIEILRNYEKVETLRDPQSFMVGGTRQKKFIDSGNTAYDAESVFGGKPSRKTVLAKTLKTVGRFLKPKGEMAHKIKQALGDKVIQQIDGYDGRKPRNIEPGMQVAEAYEVNDLGLPPLKGGKKKRGFAKFLKTVGQFVKPLNKELQPIKDAFVSKAVEKIKGSGKPKSKRGVIVSKIMKEKGLNLGAASKYVKDHKLY